jgi:hypothetical protein
MSPTVVRIGPIDWILAAETIVFAVGACANAAGINPVKRAADSRNL